MSDGAQPIYLQHRSYRRRRLIDACRVLPFVAGLLWLIPLLWPQGAAGEGVSTSRAVIYVFAVWVGAIALGAILARAMTRRDGEVGDAAEAHAGPDDAQDDPL